MIVMQSILITGSNRGVGFELARQYLRRDTTRVFATCRSPESADELHRLAGQYPGRVQIFALDVTDEATIGAAADAVHAKTDSLDLLINNAGVFPRDANMTRFGHLDAEAMLDILHINAVGPVLVAQAFAGLLRKGSHPRLINISSDAGSLAMKGGGCNYTYPASKAALNMFMRCMAGELKSAGVVTIAIHPGWVRTDMGGPGATLSVEESASGLMNVIGGLTMQHNGGYFRWDGQRMPW